MQPIIKRDSLSQSDNESLPDTALAEPWSSTLCCLQVYTVVHLGMAVRVMTSSQTSHEVSDHEWMHWPNHQAADLPPPPLLTVILTDGPAGIK
jgi:hypothetical protein